MMPLLIVLLALAVLGDVLLAVLLLQSRRAAPDPDTLARALAAQQRAAQGETVRAVQAAVRDLGALLAETQNQSAAAAGARLDAIDRTGAARQKAANDAVTAQLALLERRLKGLEDSNAARMDGLRAALAQGLETIRTDNSRKLDEIRGTVDEKLQTTLQKRISDSFRTVSQQLEQVYKGLG